MRQIPLGYLSLLEQLLAKEKCWENSSSVPPGTRLFTADVGHTGCKDRSTRYSPDGLLT